MRKRLIFIAGPILLLASATYLLGYSSLLTVSSVEVIGIASKVNLGVEQGEKLARIEPRTIATRFENLAWVKKAEVSRNWISGKVVIRILERTPLAAYKGKAFDEEGNSFVPQSSNLSRLVQIDAIDTGSALKAVDLLSSLSTELKQSLQSIKVAGTGFFDLALTQEDRTLEVTWGTDNENELKMRVYRAIIALPENRAVKKVDVSAPHAPIVK
jgi:cell division septal protein FtsQ